MVRISFKKNPNSKRPVGNLLGQRDVLQKVGQSRFKWDVI